MEYRLSISDLKILVENVVQAFPHEECETCECFLGYVAHLSTETDQPGKKFLKRYKPPQKEIHSCLGCDPCPPGDHYAQYLRARREGPEKSTGTQRC